MTLKRKWMLTPRMKVSKESVQRPGTYRREMSVSAQVLSILSERVRNAKLQITRTLDSDFSLELEAEQTLNPKP